MKYKVGKLNSPVTLLPGDRINLNLTTQLDGLGLRSSTKLIHSEEIHTMRNYTHWAFCDFGDDIDAIFMGGPKLEQFLLEKFPGIVKIEQEEALFV